MQTPSAADDDPARASRAEGIDGVALVDRERQRPARGRSAAPRRVPAASRSAASSGCRNLPRCPTPARRPARPRWRASGNGSRRREHEHDARRARRGRRRTRAWSASSGTSAARRSRRSRRRTPRRWRRSSARLPGPLPSVAWRSSSSPLSTTAGIGEQEGVARGRRAVEAEEEAAGDRRARSARRRESARRPARRRSGRRRASSATRCRGCASRRARRTAARARARSAPCRSARGCGRRSRSGGGTRARRCRSGSCPTRTYQPRRESSVWRISGLRRPRTQATRMRAISARK